MPDDALLTLHRGLPRAGPGSEASTRDALRRLPLPRPTRGVVDLGCGPGQQTLVLAETLGAPVVAVDRHQPFLDQLMAAARARGLADLIEPRCADMRAPGVAPASCDLVWSEGAAYLVGFGDALSTWRTLLRPGGCMAVSECSWLVADPPRAAAEFWAAAYPALASVAANMAAARARGLQVLDTLAVPADGWAQYYGPLLERITQARATATGALAAAVDDLAREIALYRDHGASYGYVFYLLRRPDGSASGA